MFNRRKNIRNDKQYPKQTAGMQEQNRKSAAAQYHRGGTAALKTMFLMWKKEREL